jgi:uncharacterized repeat protein (TIGR03843 family)
VRSHLNAPEKPIIINPMEQADILKIMAEGKLTLQGQFVNSSNYTFFSQMELDSQQLPVVYKPNRGEQPLWDFPTRTLARRETAAYLLSESLGWSLVPLTIYRRKSLPFGPGMVQFFIDHDVNYHYFSFSDQDRARLDVVAVFDLLINNADRKGSHVFLDADQHLWCIDHGICFHPEDKLRTVIWDFAGQTIPEKYLGNLQALINQREAVTEKLSPYLRKSEINALFRRAAGLIQLSIYPYPGTDRRMYPYPPL